MMISSRREKQVFWLVILLLVVASAIGWMLVLAHERFVPIPPPKTWPPSLAPSTFVPSSAPTTYRWSWEGEIIGPSDVDSFGWNVVFDSSGRRIAVSAPNANNGRGRIYFYETRAELNAPPTFTGLLWNTYADYLEGDNPGDYAGHGMDISVDGETVAVGSPGGGDNYGHVRVFRMNDGKWEQLGQTIRGPSAGSRFGHALSLNGKGHRIAVGAPHHHHDDDDDDDDDTHRPRVGWARVYELRGGSVWHPLGEEPFLGLQSGDELGSSVSLDSRGAIVAVGSPNDDTRWENGGRIFVYGWTDYSQHHDDADAAAAFWREYDSLHGDDIDCHLGTKVVMNDDGNAMASSESYDDNGDLKSNGRVVVGTWSGQGRITTTGYGTGGRTTDESFGYSIAMAGDRYLFAATTKNQDSDAGAVRVYSFRGRGVWEQVGDDLIIEESLPSSSSWFGDGPSVALVSNFDFPMIRVATGYESVMLSGERKSLVRFSVFAGIPGND